MGRRLNVLYLGVFLLWFFGCSLLAGAPQVSGVSRPDNYEEVKAMLERFAYAPDTNDSRIGAVQQKLMAKGAAAIPALATLFLENRDGLYRSRLLSTLNDLTGDKSEAVKVVAAEFQGELAKWENEIWLYDGMDLLVRESPGDARSIAQRIIRESKHISSDITVGLGLGTLERVGEGADIELVRKWIEENRQTVRKAFFPKAEEAVGAIQNRIEKGQP